jgi:hypothetical protein
MDLSYELARLRIIHVSPAATYRVKAQLLDHAPGAVAPDPAEMVRTCARRIEALLEDRLGASGPDLKTKAESVRMKLGPYLTEQLLELATAQTGVTDLKQIQNISDEAPLGVLRLVPDKPRHSFLSALRGPKPRTVAGVVQKILVSDGGQLALLDVDGRLVELHSQKIQIDCGDYVVVPACYGDQAFSYHNESKQLGSKTGPVFMKWLASGAAVILAGLTVVVLAMLYATSVWREHPGGGHVIAAWIGSFVTLCVGAVVVWAGIFIIWIGAFADYIGLTKKPVKCVQA